VVTKNGKAKIKAYDPDTKTIAIREDAGSTGDEAELEIRLVNATPDLGTFTEIFEITAARDTVLDASEDFLTGWTLRNGKHDITGAEWFVWEERVHTIEIPIIEYRDVAVEDISNEEPTQEENVDKAAAIEEVSAPSTNARDIAPPEGADEGAIVDEIAPEDDVTRDASFEESIVCERYIAGNQTVEQYWPEWVPFIPEGQILSAGETRLFKVIYTKPAELGIVEINTVPVFRGVECPEMTWWSTSWMSRVQVTVTNPPSIDG